MFIIFQAGNRGGRRGWPNNLVDIRRGCRGETGLKIYLYIDDEKEMRRILVFPSATLTHQDQKHHYEREMMVFMHSRLAVKLPRSAKPYPICAIASQYFSTTAQNWEKWWMLISNVTVRYSLINGFTASPMVFKSKIVKFKSVCSIISDRRLQCRLKVENFVEIL